MKKEFTKNDLRTGMIVRFRDGEAAILIGDEFMDSCFIYDSELSYYNNELFYENYYEISTVDIMEVYELKEKLYFVEMLSIIYNNDNFLNDLIEKEYVKLIWKREESKREELKREIDWSKVPPFTRVKIKTAFDGVNNRYFLKEQKTQNDGVIYLVTKCDEFTHTGFDCEGTTKIEIYNENDIKEEWYK